MLATKFDVPHLSQLFSTALQNLVAGELIQAKKSTKLTDDGSLDIKHYFENYLMKSYYKTASLLSIGCRGVGVIFDLPFK